MESTVTIGTKYRAVWMLVERREELAPLWNRHCFRADVTLWYCWALSGWACGLERCQCSASNHNLGLLCPPGPLSWVGGGSSFTCIVSIWSACVDYPLYGLFTAIFRPGLDPVLPDCLATHRDPLLCLLPWLGVRRGNQLPGHHASWCSLNAYHVPNFLFDHKWCHLIFQGGEHKFRV